jgi:hypothetical protein
MDDAYTPIARANVEYHELDDGGVVCDTSADRIHTLNLTAAYVWNCLDGSNTVGQIAADIHQLANVAMDTAVTDVRQTIAYFRNEGLLRSQ